MNIDSNILKTKLTAKMAEIVKDLANEEYDGMSNYYYYTCEEMPLRISHLRWTANDLLKGVLPDAWLNAFLSDLNGIKY